MLKINKNYVPPKSEESGLDFETSWTDWTKLDEYRYVLDKAAALRAVAIIDSSKKNFSHFKVYQYKKYNP